MPSISKITLNGIKYDLNPIVIHESPFRVFDGFSITGKEGNNIVIKQGRICIWQFNFATPSSYPSPPSEYGMYNVLGLSNGESEGFPIYSKDVKVVAQRIHGFKTDGSKTVDMLVTFSEGNLLAWMNNDPNLLNCEFWGSIFFYDKR